MSDQVLIVFGVLLIAALALTAGLMWRQVWANEKTQALIKAQTAAKNQAQQEYLVESILIICITLLRDEMNISEGAIRLKVLLDNLDQLPLENEKLSAINALHQEVSGFDILHARKNLSKQDRMAQDLARMKIEASYQAEFLNAVRHLHDALKPANQVH